jgi:hypothetical protein
MVLLNQRAPLSIYAKENALTFARASSHHLLVDYQLEFRNSLLAGALRLTRLIYG